VIDFKVAGELRPGHTTSLSGKRIDAAMVTDVTSSKDFTTVTVTLENGLFENLPLMTLLPVYED